MATYEYDLSTDFEDGIDTTCLQYQIEDHGFPNNFNGITVIYDSDNVSIDFTGNLSPNDESELNTIVSNHNPDTCTSVGIARGGYGDAESLFQSSTTSNSPQQKLKMNITDVEKGRYRIGWFYEFAHSMSSSDFNSQIELNDTDNLMRQSQEPKDPGTDQSIPCAGFAYVELSEGDHFVDLDFWAESGTAYIKNARLEIWRIS